MNEDELLNEIDGLEKNDKRVTFKKKIKGGGGSRVRTSFEEEEQELEMQITPSLTKFKKKESKKVDLSKYIQKDKIQPVKQNLVEVEKEPKFVPIETNNEPVQTKREYLNSVVNEYASESKNYDDGTEKQDSKLELNNDDDDFELNDEDMGTLSQSIDFKNKFNYEIESEDDEQQEVEILPLNDQLQNIQSQIEQLKLKQKIDSQRKKSLQSDLNEISMYKNELVTRLNKLVT